MACVVDLPQEANLGPAVCPRRARLISQGQHPPFHKVTSRGAGGQNLPLPLPTIGRVVAIGPDMTPRQVGRARRRSVPRSASALNLRPGGGSNRALSGTDRKASPNCRHRSPNDPSGRIAAARVQSIAAKCRIRRRRTKRSTRSIGTPRTKRYRPSLLRRPARTFLE